VASAYEESVSSDVTEVVGRRDDRVVTLTLDRPADQNRLTRSMLLSLQRIVDDLAGAAELSLACGIRLAASHATFALPEALWGGAPGAGGPVRLPMLVGRARALEIVCTGR
jgi:enoyl-CoA hydratase/carnithine racemase